LRDEPERVYWSPESIPRQWAARALDSGDPDAIVNALIRLTYHESDWRWVYDQCARFVSHPDANVRRNVAICFEMLARFHEALEIRNAVPLLEKLSNDTDSSVAVEAQDSIDAINLVLGPKGLDK